MKRLFLALSLIASKAISLVAVFIFAYILDITEVNKFSEVQAIIQMIIPIISLQIPAALFRFSKVREFDGIVVSIFKYSTSIYILVIPLIIISLLGYYWLIILPVVLSSICLQVHLEVIRGRYNETLYYAGNLAFVIIYVFTSLLAINLINSYVVIFACDIFSSMLVCLFLNRMHEQRLNYTSGFSKANFNDLLKYSIPLVANAMLWWFSTSGSILVSSLLVKGNSAAIANINLKASLLISTFSFIISNVYQRHLVECFEDNDNKYRKELKNYIFKSFAMILAVSVVNYLLFSWWLESFYPDYYVSSKLLLINVVSGVAYGFCAILGVDYICRKRTSQSLVSVTLGMITTVLFCLYIRDDYGVIGVMFSFMIGFVVNLIVRVRDISVNLHR